MAFFGFLAAGLGQGVGGEGRLPRAQWFLVGMPSFFYKADRSSDNSSDFDKLETVGHRIL